MIEGNGSTPNPPTTAKDSGESVATYWARVLAAAAAGEVIVVADKHGQDVAVVLGMDDWADLQAAMEELAEFRDGTLD